MEAVRTSEKSAYFYLATRRYISEGSHIHTRPARAWNITQDVFPFHRFFFLHERDQSPLSLTVTPCTSSVLWSVRYRHQNDTGKREYPHQPTLHTTWVPSPAHPSHNCESAHFLIRSGLPFHTQRKLHYHSFPHMNMSTSRSLTWIWVPAVSHMNMSTSRSLTSIWVPAAFSHEREFKPLSHMNMRNSLFLTWKWILVTFLHDIFSGKYEYTSLLSHSGVPVHTLTWTRAPDLSHDWKNERKKRSESICALRRNSVDLPRGEQCYCSQFRAQQNEM
jgi:hypothetical protein